MGPPAFPRWPRFRTIIGIVPMASVLFVFAATACHPEPESGLQPSGVRELSSIPTQGKNLIVVLSDTHRLDHVSGFAQEDQRLTPGVAQLMQDGVTFTNAYTPVPISAPAYATLMTGLKPIEHGLLNNQQRLPTDFLLLQESLAQAGYQTAAVVGNPFCSSGYGFSRGFGSYWDEVDGHGKEGEIITREAIRWLDSAVDDQPFFLFLAYMDAHTPYVSRETPASLRLEINGTWIHDLLAENPHIEHHVALTLQPGRNVVTLRFLDGYGPVLPVEAPSPLHVKDLRLASGLELQRAIGIDDVPHAGFERLGNRAELVILNPADTPTGDELVFRCYRKYRPEKIPAFYEAGIRSFDRSFGDLLDHLRARSLYRDSVVVFVSDHGEMLGEHEAWGHVGHLYQETLRVPLVIKAPGLSGGNRDSTRVDLGGLHDLLKSMAIGNSDFEVPGLEEQHRTPLIASTFPPEAPHLQSAAIQGRYKVIATANGEERAYDLEADPGESTDILEKLMNDSEIQILLAAAKNELASAAAVESLDVGTLSAAERDRLRALGYLDSGP